LLSLVASIAVRTSRTKSSTWRWTDTNGDRRWQPGEETSFLSAALEGAIQLDPDISAPYTHEAAGWFERQLTGTIGLRTGFVYKTEDNLWDDYQPGRGYDVYQQFGVAFPFTDIGLDGRANTSDDRVLNLTGLPSADADARFSPTTVVMNLPQYSRYKTFETSMSKRYSSKWSATIGGAYTWMKDFPNDYPQALDAPGVQNRTVWNFKASGSYDAPFGIRPCCHFFSPAVARPTTATTHPCS